MARLLNRHHWFWQDVRESLVSQPVKSALTFMSVSIGMLSLTLLLAILAGLENRAQQQIAEIGADVAIIALDGPSSGVHTLSATSVAKLRDLAPGSLFAGVIRYDLADILPIGPVRVIAADPGFPLIRGWQLLQGRWLDEHDAAIGSHYGVISHALATRLYINIGDTLALRETLIRVVGIMRGPADAAYCVLTTLSLPAWWSREPAGDFGYDAIHIKNATYPELDVLAKRIHRDMNGDSSPARWTVTTPDTLIASTRGMMKTVRLVYGSVTVLCLLLGGATLISLMMVNIQQRIAELGLRIAIGASKRDILLLFLSEGIFSTVVAGLIGTGAGTGLVYLLGDALEIPAALSAHVFLIPPVCSIVLGLVFSWYPARTAALISPAEALRNE